ncbi:MAG: hypothetical protein JW993_13480 [Sedimentisphaerales bacterium]|nr:hypothetical protein [Sedimentisphaerales bacterium]
MAKEPEACRWIGLRAALREFALATYGTTSQRHIKPLHWYMACRLCLEGGFDPDEITPRPPFVVEETRGGLRTICFVPESGGFGEQTIIGGLKTKQVDVVVTKRDIGPVIAVSMKGTLNAFRNLTNRLEEAGGDCTNLHMTYPSLVYAYWGLIRVNRPGPVPPNAPKPLQSTEGVVRTNDVSVLSDGQPHQAIQRYHLALTGLTNRVGLRNDVSKYEAIALTLVNTDEQSLGTIFESFPPPGDPLDFSNLMPTLYRQYDQRFVYQAPDMKKLTLRKGWAADSPALSDWHHIEYEPRLVVPEADI